MYVIILTYCLLSHPAICVEHRSIIDDELQFCALYIPEEVEAYEAAHPGWKVQKGACLDLEGQDL